MPKDTDKNPLFISIIPNLAQGEGHIIPYHQAISSANKILNWRHLVLFSGDYQSLNLPEDWINILGENNLEAKSNFIEKISKFNSVIQLAKSINIYLEKIIKEHPEQEIIIFIERFIHLQLLALYLGLLNSNIPKKNLFIWILYRRDFHTHKTRIIYKLLNQSLKKLVKTNHFQLFSDSQLLADSMSKYFQESMIVMPIPHTEFIDKIPNSNSHHNLICWWAGPPREEKGWQTIRKLSEYQGDLANNFTLVASKSSELINRENGINIILTDDNLSRTEYVNWLAKTDLILLPYDAIAYQERTSGIFTESVIAGNIPVTTAKTWMARELLKFNLGELIIDWENPANILAQFNQILNSKNVQDKLMIMRQEYRNFHNLNNFAQQFKQSLNKSRI